MQKPRYQDYKAKSIRDVEEAGVKVWDIAGKYKGFTDPVVMQDPSMLMDVQIKQVEQPVSRPSTIPPPLETLYGATMEQGCRNESILILLITIAASVVSSCIVCLESKVYIL